jgi:hypothetical protein
MNTGRFAAAVAATFVARTALNSLFYGVLVAGQWEHVHQTHPGVFREVIPAYIAADLLFAVIFVFFLTKVGAALGGGPKGGAVLGFFVALMGPALVNVYMFYSVLFFSLGMAWSDSLFALINGVVAGAVAGAVYKT